MTLPNNIRIGPLERVVLIYNVLTCEDATNDADQTVRSLVRRLRDDNERVSRKSLEAALYCCNINHEDDKYWHPFKRSFRTLIVDLAKGDWWFDEYYNLIRSNDEKKEVKYGRLTKTRG